MTHATAPVLLRIDASPRGETSFSRRIADAAESAWLRAHPGGGVTRRDLARDPVPHIADATIQGYGTALADMTPELRAATALSDALIAELKGAHTVLISSPIYNFSMPSSLKAWVDHIVRVGHTFSYEGGTFKGLVQGPRSVLALAYGVSGYQGPLAHIDHLRPLLTSLLGFIGITEVQVVAAEATSGDPVVGQAAFNAAIERARALFEAVPALGESAMSDMGAAP